MSSQDQYPDQNIVIFNEPAAESTKPTGGRKALAATGLFLTSLGIGANLASAEKPDSAKVGGLVIECAFPNPNGTCNDPPGVTNPPVETAAPPPVTSPSVETRPPSTQPPSNEGGGDVETGRDEDTPSQSATTEAPVPLTLEQRLANSPFAEDCADPTPYAWAEDSLMFARPAVQAEGIVNPASAEIIAPSQQIQTLSAELTADRGADGGSWINKVVEQCELRPLTGSEFIAWYGESAAPAFDQHRADFGYPVTNWEVIMDQKSVFNVDVSTAQNEDVLDFQGNRINDLMTNVPNLDWNAYAAGQVGLDGLPVTE